MADKVIGLRINVTGTDDVVKRIANLSAELERSKIEVKKLGTELTKAAKAGDAEGVKKYSEQLALARANQNDLKAESAKLNQELRLQQKAFRAAAESGTDSYKGLDAQLSILRNRFKQLSAAEREGEVGQQLSEDIAVLNKQLVEQDAKLGVFSRNVGNYEESVVRSLRRAGNEKGLQDRLEALTLEQERLQSESKKLFNTIERADAGTDLGQTTAEFVKVEDQIKENEKAIRRLNDALGDSEKLGSQSGRANVKGLKKAGKVAGLGGATGLAGDLFQGTEAVSQFGAAGIAAFGIFAAGGLAFKAISVLGELSKEFQKLESQTAAFSGASGAALKDLSVEVKATAQTFGKDQTELLKTTQALSKNLGVDFATALDKVQSGLLTGADASGDLLGALEGSAVAARAAGLSIDDLVVFSNEAVKDGLLSERGLELVNNFGKAIKENSSEAKKSLTEALGAEFTDNLFKNVQNGSLSTKDAIKQVSLELGKQGVSAEEASKVFVDAFGAQTAAENEFILGLKNTGTGISSYIDKANSLTATQQNQLKANKELASAQQGLATTFESFGFSIEAVSAKVKASLLNLANNAILAFNAAFGDGLAAGREQLRKTTEALNEQTKVVNELEQDYAPLIDRYDELTAQLPTLTEGSVEAEAAQAELASIITTVGERIPFAVEGFGAYNEALDINSQAARDFIATQKQVQQNLEAAQTRTAVEQLTRLRAESAALQEQITQQSKATEIGLNNIINPLTSLGATIDAVSGKRIDLSDEQILEAGQTLGKYGKEIRELEALLKTTASGREALGITISNQLSQALAATGKGNEKLADEAAKFQSETARKDAEAAKAAAERRKAERDKLIEDEKRTGEDLGKARKETDDNLTSLSINAIKSGTEREIAQIQQSTQQRIEAETQGIQDAGKARIEVLQKIAASSDPEIRKLYGTPEQVASQIDGINSEIINSVELQTRFILQERDKQIKALQDSRDKAIREAAASIDNEALNAALTEVGLRLSKSEAATAAIELEFTVNEQKIDQQASIARSKVEVLRNANIIGEREYQAQLAAIDQMAAEARIKGLADKYDAEVVQRAEAVQLQTLQLEGELLVQKQAIADERDARLEGLQTQLDNELITVEQYAAARAEIEANAAQQTVLVGEVTASEITRISDEAAAARLATENELTQAQLDLFNQRAEDYRAQQQALFQEFADNVKGLGDFILSGAKAVDDFFTASENKRKAEIEARYATELRGAQGNAQAIESLERQKAAEIEKIERAAAARRKAIAIAQAIINGAVAVTNILATTPDPTGIFTLARITLAGVTTAAQIALISSQEFEKGGAIPSGSGFISGRSHKEGGVHGTINGQSVEVEGGEYKTNDEFGNTIIINKKSSRAFGSALRDIGRSSFAGKRAMLSEINSYNGWGIPFASGGAIPPTVAIASPNAAIGDMTKQMQMLANAILETRNFVAATNARIDRLTVVADAQDIVEQGLKDTPQKNANVL